MNDYVIIKFGDNEFGITREQWLEFCKANSEEIFDLYQDDIEEQFGQELKAYFEEDYIAESGLIAEQKQIERENRI